MSPKPVDQVLFTMPKPTAADAIEISSIELLMLLDESQDMWNANLNTNEISARTIA